MLRAELVDDDSARGMLVAENAGKIAPFDECRRQLLRESRDGVREIAPVEGHGDACDFPMARGRVLALGGLDPIPPGALQRAPRCKTRGHAPCRGLNGKPEAERRHVRQVKRTLAQTGLIAPARGTGLGNMPDCIGAGIPVGSRILGSADADGIEHDE
jgi:hypothetical protein